MSVDACAGIVRRGDPDRFLAVMAAAPALREILFPIFAFNVEVARAPWVSHEPTINQIRLAWWAEALAGIESGQGARRHEVVTPLAAVIDPPAAAVLQELVAARHWDVGRDPFDGPAHFAAYIRATAGGLMWVAARAIGARQNEAEIRELGYCAGLANWFMAVAALRARGCRLLVDEAPEAVAALARDGLVRLKRARRAIPKIARPVTRSGWRAGRTLSSAAANPTAVTDGSLHISEFSRRSSLLWRVFLNAP